MLHMNGGTGDTSYAMNSFLQEKMISTTKSITEEAITALLLRTSTASPECRTLSIADLGCASGPNTLLTVAHLIRATVRVSRTTLGQGSKPLPEFQLFLNDLPGNDFNSIFASLQQFKEKMENEIICECFGDDDDRVFDSSRDSNFDNLDDDGEKKQQRLVMLFNGVPGSFYGRLFPAKSLHFVHSSCSLHWLSRVPRGIEDNGVNIAVASGSPPGVLRAYYGQFQKDFSVFLKARATELVDGGGMVLTLLGRKGHGEPHRGWYVWELLSIVLYQMASQGMIEMEKLKSFNLPIYMPSPMEVEAQVKKQGSFAIARLEVTEASWDPYDGEANLVESHRDGGCNVAKSIRAVAEPLLASQFGSDQQTMEEVFRRYSVILSERMAVERTHYVNLTLSLAKR